VAAQCCQLNSVGQVRADAVRTEVAQFVEGKTGHRQPPRRTGEHPAAELVALARDEAAPLPLSARIYSDLANYVAPKRKAEDLCAILGRQPADDETRLDFSRLSDAELEAFTAMLQKAREVD
jgi:hypothetical protein